MTDAPDIRRIPVRDAIAWLSEHGEAPDPRPDIDTASLVARFPRLAGVQTLDYTVEGPHGPVPLRSYRDPSVPASARALVWVHGGAFIGGHLEMPESNWVARELAARGIPVLAVDYTKALRDVHYPVPSDDVLAAWRYARENSESLLGMPAGALTLGGASAGATLTSGVVQRLIDAGEPVPSGLVLVYPLVHANGPDPANAPDLEGHGGQLSLNYAGTVDRLTDPQVFAGAGTGAGFPATLIVTCEFDELRPSGEAFAATLRSAGREVELYEEPGASHGHIDHPGDEGALRTIERVAAWLQR